MMIALSLLFSLYVGYRVMGALDRFINQIHRG